MTEVDLDRLAAGRRHRPPSHASLQRARLAGETLHSESAILDVGGGPGRRRRFLAVARAWVALNEYVDTYDDRDRGPVAGIW